MNAYERTTFIIAIASGLAIFVSGFGFGVIYSTFQLKKLQRLLKSDAKEKTIS